MEVLISVTGEGQRRETGDLGADAEFLVVGSLAVFAVYLRARG